MCLNHTYWIMTLEVEFLLPLGEKLRITWKATLMSALKRNGKKIMRQ